MPYFTRTSKKSQRKKVEIVRKKKKNHKEYYTVFIRKQLWNTKQENTALKNSEPVFKYKYKCVLIIHECADMKAVYS